MMRGITDTNKQLLVPIEITAACAGLTVLQKGKLELPDALAYVGLITTNDLLTSNENANIDIPAIKPVLATINRITANPTAVYDFCAQILVLSGANEAKINAMDVRDFMPLMPEIVSIFTTGKATQG
jgi:hypothetical protein